MGCLALILATYLLLRQGDVYQSPDESSNRIFTEAFGTTGKVWYEDELVALDEENLLHPRGVLTYDDRAVPFNFLGLPVAYGALYALIGEDVRYVAILIAGATAFFIYRATNVMFGARTEDTLAVLLGCTPLFYYFNRPYMNALPAIGMFSLGIWMLARFGRKQSFRDLILASAAFSLAMFFRYEYLLFCGPLLALTVAIQSGVPLSRRAAWLAGAGSIVMAVFVVPVFMLNQYVYGDWSTYGYSLFNDAYYPSKGGAEAGLFESIRAALFPSSIDVEVVARNLIRFTVLLVPVLAVLAVVGAWLLIRQRLVRWRTLLAFSALLAFFLCYRGSSATWGAAGMAPTFDAAIVRYWLPMYLGFVLLATYALSQIADRWLKTALAGALAITAAITLLWSFDGNLSQLANGLESQQRWSEDVLVPLTEEDAVVYAGRSDKRIVPYRFTAAWWNGAEFYDPSSVARSMSRVHTAGRPIYIRHEPEVDIDELNKELAKFRLVSIPAGHRALSSVIELPADGTEGMR
jgi:hypothetical protein